MSALLSGELRDTADLRSLVIALDAFVSLEESSYYFIIGSKQALLIMFAHTHTKSLIYLVMLFYRLVLAFLGHGVV